MGDQSFFSKKLDDFTMIIAGKEYVPLIQGGMGVDISTRSLAQVVASLGGIGTISDAMIQTVIDKDFKTRYVAEKLKKYKSHVGSVNKSGVRFDISEIYEAQTRHIKEAMAGKVGKGSIFINIMEKLTMNSPKETLKARLNSALDAGIDGITLSAGLHLSSFDLMKDNARFKEASLGIIVSSARALGLFIKRSMRLNRLPDFVVVEGPLAGGHLGFGIDDWKNFDLKLITKEVLSFLKEKTLPIPVIPAGGIFTGSDAVEYLEMGASGVQVATRFIVSKECGLPDDVKQKYLAAEESNIVVNTISTTGYPMRMLDNSPAIGSGIRPNCESFGYLLDSKGNCSYITAYNNEVDFKPEGEKLKVFDKTCLCTHMRKFNLWTCGSTTWRLKDTTTQNEDGTYALLDAAHIFKDYQFSVGNSIALPDSE